MTEDFDAIVAGLVALNVPRTKAEARARELCGVPEPERDTSALERQEQAECYKVFRAFGGKVRNLSQARATKQAPGLGDAFVCFPRVGFACWWETKRQVGGRHSPAQVEFRADCEACGIPYETGDRFAARALIVRLGLATDEGGVLHPTGAAA